MPVARSRYQQGTVELATRKKGPDVWIYRWRERTIDGKLASRKKTIGPVSKYKTASLARRAAENLRAQANSREDRLGKLTIEQAWGHFQKYELDRNREPTTLKVYREYFRLYIIPKWGEVLTEELRTVDVEDWLGKLPYTDGTKAKIRNLMSALFSHLLRHRLYQSPLNPIKYVRQSSTRQRDPDILSLEEIKAILSRIYRPEFRLMLLLAATTGLRRSELRGLKWSEVDLKNNLLHLTRGLVRKDLTKLKTKASRKPVPLLPDMTKALEEWKALTAYSDESDWLFASPFTQGFRPYWLDMVLADHIQPAASAAGIRKQIGWHTFRHSLASNMGADAVDPKVVQEILRHASLKIKMDIYQQTSENRKREAISASMSKIFQLKGDAASSKPLEFDTGAPMDGVSKTI